MEGRAVGHNFERDPLRDHPCQVWFSGFRGEDLNVIFYQNMPNLHNRFFMNFELLPILTDYAN
jgi:hypothetical protein